MGKLRLKTQKLRPARPRQEAQSAATATPFRYSQAPYRDRPLCAFQKSKPPVQWPPQQSILKSGLALLRVFHARRSFMGIGNPGCEGSGGDDWQERQRKV